MKKYFGLLVLLVFVLSFNACNNTKNKKQLTEKDRLINEIATNEEKLFNDSEPNKEKAGDMIKMYLNYVQTYPEDTLSPEYLFKASEIAMNFEQPHNAIRYLSQIEDNYPNFSKYPTCLFMKGHIYHNIIGDLTKAKEYYQIYIDKYPDHTFTKDAESALMFLDLDDAQLIDLFEDMNKYN